MADPLPHPIAIASIDKNAGTEVRVSLSAFKGINLIDVRAYAAFSAAKVPMATKRGIALNVERLPQLVAALQAAEAKARELGLIGRDV